MYAFHIDVLLGENRVRASRKRVTRQRPRSDIQKEVVDRRMISDVCHQSFACMYFSSIVQVVVVFPGTGA